MKTIKTINDFHNVARIDWVVYDCVSELFLYNATNWKFPQWGPHIDDRHSTLEISEHWRDGEFNMALINCSPNGVPDTFRRLDEMDAEFPLHCLPIKIYRDLGGERPDGWYVDQNITVPDFSYLVPYRQLVLQFEGNSYYE